MMILDTVAISYILKNNLSINGDYFITPDIEEEVGVNELIWKKKIPTNIKNIFLESSFNKHLYIKNYYNVLNNFSGRSFFNMTGFGDVSIISLIKTLIETEEERSSKQLPFAEYKQEIILYTGDSKLSDKVVKEFGSKVELFSPDRM